MAQNMYRVGDYVYFEISSAAPYQVRRIEELTKTQTGNVEAKVLCYYRRRDVSPTLLKISDRAELIDDRAMINTRRRLTCAKTEVNGDGDDTGEDSSDAEDATSSSENGHEGMEKLPKDLSMTSEDTKECEKEGEADKIEEAHKMETEEKRETEERRDLSESPKPMQVDTTGDNEEEPKKAPEEQPAPEVKLEKPEEKLEKPQEKPEEKEEEGEKEKEVDSEDDKIEGGYGMAGLPVGSDALTPKERHSLRQHELFLSRQVESLPATHIRGKCTVTLLSEVETPDSYLGKDDVFFYSLVYDAVAMTLLADKGEIREGDKYQCVVPEGLDPEATKEKDDNKENGNLVIDEEEMDAYEAPITTTEREVLVYHPHHNLTDRDIDQFLIIARAVGTFSRALDTSSSMKLPSLHMTAAAASRDVTLFHAMALLHQANYDIGQAVKYLVPPPSKQHYPLDADKTTSHNTVSLGGPILCRDQMEEWSAAEASLFEEAIEKYGKDFIDIRVDFLPWKSLRDIVEYYYMWKTTNRYVEVKKGKAAEQESKLKQVYIPNYNKPNPNLVGPPNAGGHLVKGTSPCESCQADESLQWYAWGPAHLQLRLCNDCWSVWKKSGGLKRMHKYESYDLDGAASVDMLNPAQQAQAQRVTSGPLLTSTTLIKSNSTLPLFPGNRNGAFSCRPTGGQVVARLPPNHHPQHGGQGGGGHHKPTALSTVAVGPKTRVAFYLNTTLSMRIARRLAPKPLLNIRRSARRPFLQINGHAIKQYCTTRQPLELIRAAKQIKGNKLPDAVLTQLAASIIASGSQFASFTGGQQQQQQSTAAATGTGGNVHKRALPMPPHVDKSLPPVKRMHVSSSSSSTPQQYTQHASTVSHHHQHPTFTTIKISMNGAGSGSGSVAGPMHQRTSGSSTQVHRRGTSDQAGTYEQQFRAYQQYEAHHPFETVHHEPTKPVAAVSPHSQPPMNAMNAQHQHQITTKMALQKAALLLAQQQSHLTSAQKAQFTRAMQAACGVNLDRTALVATSKEVLMAPTPNVITSTASETGTGIGTGTRTGLGLELGSGLGLDSSLGLGEEKKADKSHPDSRWSGADERLLFLAGPRFKTLRKRLCVKKMARRVAIHPCRSSDFVTKQLPCLHGMFI